MSIGKDAIKRVENNGYSSVVTSAPDMENSVISEVPEETPAKSPAKSPARKKVPAKDGFVRVQIGEELPVWLL